MKPALVFLVVAFFFCGIPSPQAQAGERTGREAANDRGAGLERANCIEQKEAQLEHCREGLRQTATMKAKEAKKSREVERGSSPEEKPAIVLFGPKGSAYLSGLLE